MIPRTFRLVNGNGVSYDITSKQTFFHEPSGLGFSKSNTYHQVGSRFILVNSQPEQISVQGSVAFLGDDPYGEYFKFVSFCQIEPLYLFYTPDPDLDPAASTSGRTYRLPVTVSRIDKSEILKEGYLDCSITFEALSPWIRYIDLDNGDQATKVEPLVWGITWGVRFGFNPFSEGIVSDGNTASPARLTIRGPITNPTWSLYVNGNKVSDGAFDTATHGDFVLAEGENLVIDNTVTPYSITKVNTVTGEVENVYQKTDFTTTRFINLNPGRNIVFVKDDENKKYFNARLEAYLYYDTV